MNIRVVVVGLGERGFVPTVVVVGRGSEIARAVALLARSEGARAIVAGADYLTRSLAVDLSPITADLS